MKRLLLALCLTVTAVAAQAENFNDRSPKSSRHKSSTHSPALVSAVLKWLASKSAPSPAVHHASRRHRAPAAPVETTASETTTAPMAAPAPAPTPAAPATATPDTPLVPRVVATLTVVPPTPGDTKHGDTKHHGGRHECTTGERIITAFYWEGKFTATGARFDPNGMTAAHRTFPFGTRLLVTNPRNGKSVTVTINDRGPFTKGVTLDLSLGAAKAIGLQGNAAVCMAKA